MSGSATCHFQDAAEYQAAFRGMFFTLVPTERGRFAASRTRITLRNVHLLRAEEMLSRVAFVTLPPEKVFVSFSVDADKRLIWRGQALGRGEIMLHGRGERLHQRTEGPSCWGLISVRASALAEAFRVLTGRVRADRKSSQILLAAEREWAHLLRIHAEAAHLAETQPGVLRHPEVIRGMEQELTALLVACLGASEVRIEPEATRNAAELVDRFEAVVAANPRRVVSPPELRGATGASDRALRQSCEAVLGITPRHYMRLRRLLLVRDAILRADPADVRLGELISHGGFTDYHSFAMMYRDTLGETPSATLHRWKSPTGAWRRVADNL